MSNKAILYPVQDYTTTKQQLLRWASRYNSCCFLDNHQYTSAWQQQECLVAAGVQWQVKANAGKALPLLQSFLQQHKGEWVFGHLSYDLKAETEGIASLHPTNILFPDLCFFVPEVVVQLQPEQIIIHAKTEAEAEAIWRNIQSIQEDEWPSPGIDVRPRIDRQTYIGIIEKLRAHILQGDCYEINFCQEYFAENIQTNAAQLYKKLSDLSPNPFSCYYRIDSSHLMCASPERYLMKKGNRLYSQPIKGTAARVLNDARADETKKQELSTSPKERSENVMVVDLVRNDLSRICKEGSVQVDELFGIYSYPQVHQMISTISGEIEEQVSFADIIGASFPMGSMTGAPKRRVLQLIEQYEVSRRGIFSGAVGYIAPNGDFDFNVVIRSLMYEQSTGYLSYQVGSGITWYAKAAQEHDECLLKAEAIKKVLRGSE